MKLLIYTIILVTVSGCGLYFDVSPEKKESRNPVIRQLDREQKLIDGESLRAKQLIDIEIAKNIIQEIEAEPFGDERDVFHISVRNTDTDGAVRSCLFMFDREDEKLKRDLYQATENSQLYPGVRCENIQLTVSEHIPGEFFQLHFSNLYKGRSATAFLLTKRFTAVSAKKQASRKLEKAAQALTPLQYEAVAAKLITPTRSRLSIESIRISDLRNQIFIRSFRRGSPHERHVIFDEIAIDEKNVPRLDRVEMTLNESVPSALVEMAVYDALHLRFIMEKQDDNAPEETLKLSLKR